MVMELKGLVEPLGSITHIRGPGVAPRLVVEQQLDARSRRSVGSQADDARAFFGPCPLELFIFLQISDLGDPRRVRIDLRAVPVVLVERIQSLPHAHPDRSLLARLQYAVPVAFAFRYRPQVYSDSPRITEVADLQE